MSLSPGHRIGNYEILGPAGAGGMGEVYRARDTRLGRTVAVKALPAGVSGNAQRLARFEREARLLAALNHTNIAIIHGIEDGEGGPYLVLEFVEGPTLSQQLATGPLPLTDAIRIGSQIAAAVEAAHEKGIVHRDLKPGNVMLTSSGAVKVLDFGLAKEDGPVDDSAPDLSASPTMTNPATGEGVVLGTAPYMSPEQARGKPADKRVDVWAFGCILMECLTGKQVFPGETPSDVIAKILEREPDWDELPPATPQRLRDLLRRCLTKEIGLRPRDIGDLGRELRMLLSDSQSGSGSFRAASDETPSVAVLYFENLAKDPDSEYFCAGITEDILTDLSKIAGLQVASKNAVSRYRGQEVDLKRVAQDLGVQAVLEGSVRRSGDRIRITVQLINAANGFQLWGERFDRTLDDVFAVQDEIAGAIVQALRVAMSPSDIEEIHRERPSNAKAYDVYLRGREKYAEYTREANQEAHRYFREALELDGDYALAWAGIADAHSMDIQYGWSRDTAESGRLGLEAARKAITLDPRLPEAYKAEANIHFEMGRPEEAAASLHKAVEVNPRFLPALINLGVQAASRYEVARAERYMRRVIALDRNDAFATGWLAAILQWTGRYEEARDTARRVREISTVSFYRLGSYQTEFLAVQAGIGDDAALAVVDEAVGDSRVDPERLLPLVALGHAIRGRLDEAREAFRRAAQMDVAGDEGLAILAEVGSRLGEHEEVRRVYRGTHNQAWLEVAVRMQPACRSYRMGIIPEATSHPLVWPLEAPMLDRETYDLFPEVRVETGLPDGVED